MFHLTKLNIFVLNYINFNFKIRYEQLNMISEKKLVTICHHQLYKRRIAKVHDRKVRPREFKKWDLVLRKNLPLPGEDHSQWAPNYEGPYVVKKAFLGGALLFTKMDEEDLPMLINSDSVKRYYIQCINFHPINKNEVLDMNSLCIIPFFSLIYSKKKRSAHFHPYIISWAQLNIIFLISEFWKRMFFLWWILKSWTWFFIIENDLIFDIAAI